MNIATIALILALLMSSLSLFGVVMALKGISEMSHQMVHLAGNLSRALELLFAHLGSPGAPPAFENCEKSCSTGVPKNQQEPVGPL